MNTKLQELKSRLREASDLNSAASVLYWDQTTYMPSGGAAARGRQMAALQMLAQEKATDPAIGRLLDDLQPYEESLPYEDDDASLLRVARRDYERQTRLPADFVGEMAEHSIESYQTWIKARPANDFAAVAPMLEKTLDLSRRYADYFPGYDHIADPLIDESDPGMTVATLRPLFKELRAQLVPLVDAIAAQPVPDDSFIYRDFMEQQQWDFGVDIVRRYGYDFERGRQDKTHHPYMIRFSAGDVRITTRFSKNNLIDGLFSTLHEAGHAMYEQGVALDYDATPLGHGASSGVHESQSRLWENVVGRSRPFWSYFYPRLQAVFPAQLNDVSEDAFYRAINLVRPSLIRVDADEVTYNLHVIIRFELELALLEGTLARICPMPGRPVTRKALASRRLTTAMACCRTSTGIPDPSEACSRATHWAISWARLSGRRLRRPILTSRTTSGRANSQPCTAGWLTTSTATGASSPPTS